MEGGRSSPSAADAGRGIVGALLSADELGDVAHLTVEEWLKGHMERLASAADALSDEAVDTLLLAHKQAREEIRNWQHQGRAEAAQKSKAAKRVTWDVTLTVESAGDGADDAAAAAVGRSFTLAPRQRAGGMCRIGRSTGGDFVEPRGCSLPFDASISVWHGKFTAVCGSVYYSDLATRNGSTHNGSAVPKDVPTLLADGDELGLGDVRLRVRLTRVAAGGEENDAER